MRAALLVVLALVVTLALAEGSVAHADEGPRAVQLTMPHYAYDLAYVATGGALYLAAHYGVAPRAGDVAPLGGRGAHGYRRGPDLASDLTVGLVLAAGPIVGFLVDGTRAGRYALALRVPVVLVESFVMASAITGMLKNLGVCRPYAWQPATDTCEAGAGAPSDARDNRRSFPSGHATSAASIAGALVGMWLLPSGRDDRLAPLAIVMTALAIATAALRVRAGAHSAVDVGVGFGLGSAVGLATTALHVRREDSRIGVSPTAGGVQLHGAF